MNPSPGLPRRTTSPTCRARDANNAKPREKGLEQRIPPAHSANHLGITSQLPWPSSMAHLTRLFELRSLRTPSLPPRRTRTSCRHYNYTHCLNGSPSTPPLGTHTRSHRTSNGPQSLTMSPPVAASLTILFPSFSQPPPTGPQALCVTIPAIVLNRPASFLAVPHNSGTCSAHPPLPVRSSVNHEQGRCRILHTRVLMSHATSFSESFVAPAQEW